MTDKPERLVFKIKDGLGTTRAHQSAIDGESALAQYAASVEAQTARLLAAGWIAVRDEKQGGEHEPT